MKKPFQSSRSGKQNTFSIFLVSKTSCFVCKVKGEEQKKKIFFWQPVAPFWGWILRRNYPFFLFKTRKGLSNYRTFSFIVTSEFCRFCNPFPKLSLCTFSNHFLTVFKVYTLAALKILRQIERMTVKGCCFLKSVLIKKFKFIKMGPCIIKYYIISKFNEFDEISNICWFLAGIMQRFLHCIILVKKVIITLKNWITGSSSKILDSLVKR